MHTRYFEHCAHSCDLTNRFKRAFHIGEFSFASDIYKKYSLILHPEWTWSRNSWNTSACSDSSAKLIYSQLRVENDSPSSWLGFVYREGGNSDYLENSGDFSVNYCYATKSVKLTGAIRARTIAGSDSTRGELIVQYDLSFEKGWNQEVQSFVSQSVYVDSGKTIKSSVYSFTSYEPFPGRWIYSSN